MAKKKPAKSKMDIASQIVEDYMMNPDDGRTVKQVKAELVKKAKLSAHGSNTYYYLIRNKILEDES